MRVSLKMVEKKEKAQYYINMEIYSQENLMKKIGNAQIEKAF